MSYRNMTLSEKKRIYRKIGAVVAAAAILCVMLVIALRPADGGQADGRTTTQPIEGMIEVDGVKYVPKKNIETYLFMGIDNMGKVQKVTDYEGAGRCDVVMLMVRDLTDGTYRTISLDRNLMVEQESLKPDGTSLGPSVAQLSECGEDSFKLPGWSEDRRIRRSEHGSHRNYQQSGGRRHGHDRGRLLKG